MKIRKVLAILLTLAMALSLVACGGGTKEEPKAEEPKAAPAPAAAPVPNADDFAKFQAFMAMQNAANAVPAEEASVEEEKTEE